MDETLARKIFKQIMEGVQHIHAQGCAHLDLKHDNILLDENLNIKICDFSGSTQYYENYNRISGTI